MRISDLKVRRRRWVTHYAPLIVWTIVILGLGSSMGSMNETSRFIRPLLEFLFPSAAPETLTFVHGIIRKLAHFVEYSILGFLSLRAFQTLIDGRYKSPIVAFVLSAVVASLDEFQQSFNPARTSSPYDVFIDICGAAFAICVMVFAARKRSSDRIRA